MTNKIKIIQELLPGVFLLQNPKSKDKRGEFIKTYHNQQLQELGLILEAKEEFYSISKKNVVRGMHFQIPPNDHSKIVYCPYGRVNDVLLDLRAGDGYGRYASVELSSDNNFSLYIPSGIAHGFLSLSDDSIVMYKTSTVHSPHSDLGIRWDSFGYSWNVINPILSERDRNHLLFSDFKTLF